MWNVFVNILVELWICTFVATQKKDGSQCYWWGTSARGPHTCRGAGVEPQQGATTNWGDSSEVIPQGARETHVQGIVCYFSSTGISLSVIITNSWPISFSEWGHNLPAGSPNSRCWRPDPCVNMSYLCQNTAFYVNLSPFTLTTAVFIYLQGDGASTSSALEDEDTKGLFQTSSHTLSVPTYTPFACSCGGSAILSVIPNQLAGSGSGL